MMAFVIIGFILLVVSVIRIKKIQKEYITKNEKQVANE